MEHKNKELKRLYWIWADMKYRCQNKKHKAYYNYGAIGITVCDRWMVFQNFLDDMGERPDGMLLDRTDNNKGYSPENCKWVTRKQQNSNRRSCIYIKDKKETVTMKEFCRRKNLKYRAVMKRIRDRGWSIEDAITIPVNS